LARRVNGDEGLGHNLRDFPRRALANRLRGWYTGWFECGKFAFCT
jgi:hypothetical protein